MEAVEKPPSEKSEDGVWASPPSTPKREDSIYHGIPMRPSGLAITRGELEPVNLPETCRRPPGSEGAATATVLESDLPEYEAFVEEVRARGRPKSSIAPAAMWNLHSEHAEHENLQDMGRARSLSPRPAWYTDSVRSGIHRIDFDSLIS